MSKRWRVAINGYGRIGRCVLRAWREYGVHAALDIVAINEPADLETLSYLTAFDSTHGVFPGRVERVAGGIVVDGHRIAVSHATEPEQVDWQGLGIDLLLECSGVYGTRDALQRFLAAGCPRVLVSHPAASAQDVEATIVPGVNDDILQAGQRLVSAASCTTNASVPVLHALDRHFGVEHAFLTTLHSVMNDQPMIDGYHHRDLRRTRSAMQSMVPVATGLSAGVERLLPQLAGKVRAKAIRVPVLNVSAIDLMVDLRDRPDTERLNACLQACAEQSGGLMGWTRQPHASVDFNHDPHSVVVDLSQTQANGSGSANVFLWFDNEWGFANRMLDVARRWAALSGAG